MAPKQRIDPVVSRTRILLLPSSFLLIRTRASSHRDKNYIQNRYSLGQPKSAAGSGIEIVNVMCTGNCSYFSSNHQNGDHVWNQQEVSGSGGALVLAMVKWSTTRTDVTGSGDEADLHLLGYLR